MRRLHELYTLGGQSPWLDNLDRRALNSGELAQWIADGVRGVTSNPTIFAKSMSSSDAYDTELGDLMAHGADVAQAYWRLAQSDVGAAADLFRPLFEQSGGVDGYVSIEVDPHLADKTAATVQAGVDLAQALARPNVLIKVPATAAGIPAIRELTARGINVNVTLIFSLERYDEVIEAYQAGLGQRSGPLTTAVSVASFFVSRVDTEVDRRLETIGSPAALALRGQAAVSQARLAYALFEARFGGPRWADLAARGARVQRPLWASTSTKNPAYPDTLYVDTLIGPQSVNTLPENTLEALSDQTPVVGIESHHVCDGAQRHQWQKGVQLGLRAGVELAALTQLGA